MLFKLALGIHVGAMLAATVLLIATEALLAPGRRGDSSAIRKSLRAARFGTLAADVGVLAGVVLAVGGGWSPLTPWLLVSLALVATVMVTARKLVRPWQDRVRSALDNAATAADLSALASDRSALAGRIAVIALFGAIAALMTAKPAL